MLFRTAKTAMKAMGDRFLSNAGTERNILGPAKTYILRGTARTYAIKNRVVTDNPGKTA